MCKFHKDVARDIATNEAGDFNPGKYAVALTAMAHFRIEQHMPAMFGNDGFVPASMATPEAQQALKDSGLRTCPHASKRFRDANIGMVRAAMDATAAVISLDPAHLNIAPGEITRDGFKATKDAKPDPTVNGPFMDHAVVYLFDGYEDAKKTRVAKDGALRLSPQADDARFEAIRTATEHFVSRPGVMPALEQMFKDSLAQIFKNAPEAAKLGQGFNATAGCVMCHDDGRRDAIHTLKPKKG